MRTKASNLASDLACVPCMLATRTSTSFEDTISFCTFVAFMLSNKLTNTPHDHVTSTVSQSRPEKLCQLVVSASSQSLTLPDSVLSFS